MQTLGMDILIEFGKITLAMTDPELDNNKLVDFGLCGQQITIKKNDNNLNANICGVTVNTYYRFDRIFKFMTIFGNSAKQYVDDMAVQIAIEQYKKYIQNIERVKSMNPDMVVSKAKKTSSANVIGQANTNKPGQSSSNMPEK